MRLSLEHPTETVPAPPADPTAPDLSFLARELPTPGGDGAHRGPQSDRDIAAARRRGSDSLLHDHCMHRMAAAVNAARANGSNTIDVVTALARCVPVTLGHTYLGIPVITEAGRFENS